MNRQRLAEQRALGKITTASVGMPGLVAAVVTALAIVWTRPVITTAAPSPTPFASSSALLVGLRAGVTADQAAALHAAVGSRVIRQLPQIAVDVVTLGENGPGVRSDVLSPDRRPAESLETRLSAMAAAYASSPFVRFVERDATLRIVPSLASTALGTPLRPSRFLPVFDSLFARPNDPSFDAQWMHATMHSIDGWDRSHADGIVIAVVDTGVDCQHADLQAACIAGRDVVNQDDDPSDDQGHGTIEAGVAAAVADNAVGVAGLGWGAKIMPIKAMRADGSGSNSTITEGILWAADHGARVINLSLGGNTPSQAMADAARYAFAKGALLAAAMGNQGDNSVSYPAAYDQVVGVAATTRADSHAAFSVYGDHCDVAAPGADILTTKMGGGYYRYDGTSEATAVVSGLAALLAAQKPSRSPAEIEQIMKETAVDLGPTGPDPYFGAGRVDAGAALAKDAPRVPTATAVPPSPTPPPTAAPPASVCQRRTLRVWGFPDTVGVAGPGRPCRGCDGVFSTGDHQAGSACPLGPLTVRVADAADPSRVYWEGELPRSSASAVDVQAYVSICQPPPYVVTLLTTATACYKLCPTARAETTLTQADFDRYSRTTVGSGGGRQAEVRWYFWQCAN